MAAPSSLVVSTCGTSLLTNLAGQESKNLLRRTVSLKENELDPADRAAIADLAATAGDSLASASLADLRRMAAELNGLVAYYQGKLSAARSDTHVLLHTDTYQGALAASRLADALRAHGLSVQVERVRDLTFADPEAFALAMNELVDWCRAFIPDYREKRYRIAFNLVGGFKALQAFMQTLGMFYADEILYIFEGSDALLRIPRLPVAFDETAHRIVADNLPLFRQLALGAVPADRCPPLPETLLCSVGGEATLSPWGKLLWDQCRPHLYHGTLLDPPTDCIRYSQRFRNEAARLAKSDPHRLVKVNERIDDLARLLLTEKGRNRLDLMEEFRPLIADSVVLGVVNNAILTPADFMRRGPAVALKPIARKKFIQAYERRLDSLVTHSVFGYRISYRRVLEVQLRLLARLLAGEIPAYPAFRTR